MSAPVKPIRSPSYPNASLSEAISQVRKIEQLYRSSSVDREVAAKIIGYSSLSGPANKALAALGQYGLVERAGKGEMRVTSRAQAILHPNNDTEQRQQLRAAAMEPQLFRELQERFPNMVPPDDGVVTFLNRQGFNQTAIRPAAKAYLQTLRFLEESGASESHGEGGAGTSESAASDGGEDGKPQTYGGARVGDLIQWESQGELRLEKPMRVRLVSDDGRWVAVEGSETGIPMGEVIVQERAKPPSDPAPQFPLSPPPKPPRDESEPFRVAASRGALEGDFRLKSEDEVDELVRALTAFKLLLKPLKAVKPPEDHSDLA